MRQATGCRERQYCIGCGLCKSRFGAEKADVRLNEKGFYEPQFRLTEDEYRQLQRFCPVDTEPSHYSERIWGERKRVCLGHAADESVRLRASSGGILTAVCGYLLDTGTVDGVIQIGDSPEPLRPAARISRTREELAQCAGSRYIAAMPMENLLQTLAQYPQERFAVVGRPCDIRGLRAYVRDNEDTGRQIVCMLSFFCAGTPSVNASKKMIRQMGADENDVTHVAYRGNGWPGFSTVRNSRGREFTMTYNDSWGKILGRDLYRGCRFCYDGIGEEADIACGDAWYLDESGKVCFDERPGRNVIFARTELGEQILQQAEDSGWIVCEPFDEEALKDMQPFQYVRKAQLRYKLLAVRTIGREIPTVQIGRLAKFRGLIPAKDRARMYLGTLQRVLKRKI